MGAYSRKPRVVVNGVELSERLLTCLSAALDTFGGDTSGSFGRHFVREHNLGVLEIRRLLHEPPAATVVVVTSPDNRG